MDLSAYTSCTLCPRACGVDRSQARGLCGQTDALRVARAALHFWEEPPISGSAGSGTIFFTGCPLACVYCQNWKISHQSFGEEISSSRLAKIMLELEEQGAHNVNLVTALHFAPHVREAIYMAKDAGLSASIVCNTSGYESAETIQALSDVIDIWLCDYKYASALLAQSFSAACDYPSVCEQALAAMQASLEACGGRSVDERGIMQRGLIIRHLILPAHSDDSCAVLDRIWELFGTDVDLSLMNQYTANERCLARGDELSEKLSEEEYEKVLRYAYDLGFKQIWWQESGTVSESFIPAFDSTGVFGPELL